MLIALLGAIGAARDHAWAFALLLFVMAGCLYLRHNRYGAAGDAHDE